MRQHESAFLLSELFIWFDILNWVATVFMKNLRIRVSRTNVTQTQRAWKQWQGYVQTAGARFIHTARVEHCVRPSGALASFGKKPATQTQTRNVPFVTVKRSVCVSRLRVVCKNLPVSEQATRRPLNGRTQRMSHPV